MYCILINYVTNAHNTVNKSKVAKVLMPNNVRSYRHSKHSYTNTMSQISDKIKQSFINERLSMEVINTCR